jgi:methyl-accepting chemotaxis protein
MKLKDMTIGRRLGAAFGILLLLLVAVTWRGLAGMHEIGGRLDSIAGENNTELRAANTMRIAAFERALTVRNLHIASLSENADGAAGAALAAERADRLKKEADRVAGERARFAKAQGVLAALYAGRSAQSDKARALLDQLTRLDRDVIPLEDQLFAALREQKDYDATFAIIKRVRNVLRTAMGVTTELAAQVEAENALAADEAKAAYERTQRVMLVLSALAVALGAVLAWLATRSITRPIRRAVEVADTVAKGDLGVRIEVGGADETGQLMQSLKDMTHSLSGIVGEVRAASASISVATGEIASGNLELSARTEQQASALEETAASMEELTSTVRANAEHARAADQLVASAAQVATRGGAVVDEVVRTMGSIDASARKITDITGVIDGIAFQTNILALNAAVEAARAGDQGRGFAVVAAEVRSLAQRSATAAREIKALIDAAVGTVGAGNELAGQAGATMNEVAASVRRVSEIMARITQASHEQRDGIEEVNRAIVQIDGVTQQNAALVEEATAAAHSMQEQAALLSHSVSLFKLDEGAGSATAAEPRRGASAAAGEAPAHAFGHPALS